MKAVAFSNNDIALVAWTYDRRLPDCLGFAVFRCDPDGKNPVALPALARFAAVPVTTAQTTEQAPIQKFWWKDLGAERGHRYSYRIVPMGGPPGALVPLAGVAPLQSNAVTLTPDRGCFKAYFNRGIVASQAVVKLLGTPSADRLKARIADPNDKLRVMLQGQLMEGLTSLLDRADAGGGTVHAALYELADPKGLERRLQGKPQGKPAARNVILGNAQSQDSATKQTIVDTCAPARAALKAAGVPVVDRILPSGRIPHNKFMLLSEGDGPVAVLTGSTNWTTTGLCTQTNNALVIESPAVAEAYAEYWDALLDDTNAAANGGALQGPALRTRDHDSNAAMLAKPIPLEDGSGTVALLASPNTKGLLPKVVTTLPNDMAALFAAVKAAKQAVLFLAFDPGNNSILEAAAQALAANPNLFVRGALTNAQRAENFAKALQGAGDQVPKPGGMQVAVIGEAGAPKPQAQAAAPKAAATQVGATQVGATQAAATQAGARQIDYRAIPAGSIGKDDAFGAWEAELYKVGHAIIHNKIVVIDPFSDDCVVITGSHNLGARASHNNDETMVIVRGHKPLAAAYACHVLDVYDHYAWRYWLHRFPAQFGRPLDETDAWQDRYIKDAEEKSPELRFWLGAQPVHL